SISITRRNQCPFLVFGKSKVGKLQIGLPSNKTYEIHITDLSRLHYIKYSYLK
ncbi:hypothetical protein K1T71_001885, partial [Dendrolimus kikuchii]